MQPHNTLLLDDISELKARYNKFIEQNPGPYTIDVRCPERGPLFANKENISYEFDIIEDLTNEFLKNSGVLYVVAAKFNRVFSIRRKHDKWSVRIPIVQAEKQAETTIKLTAEEAQKNPSIAKMLKDAGK